MLYSKNGLKTTQCCLKKPVQYSGTGLHNGLFQSITLLPAPANSGMHFLRTDVDFEQAVIAASWRNIVDSPLCTVLANQHGVSVNAVEYLLATLRICGIDNVLIEVSGEEIPAITPGDLSLPSLIHKAGVVSQQAPRFGIWIERPIEVRLGEQSALLSPSTRPAITAEVELADKTSTDVRFVSVPLLDHIFKQQVLPAQDDDADDRRFRLRESRALRHTASGTESFYQIDESLTDFADAIPVQIILPALGGLVLAETPVFGHLFVNSPGPQLTQALIREIFARPHAWTRQSYQKIWQKCAYGKTETESRLH